MVDPGVLCKVTRANYNSGTPMSKFKYQMVIPVTLVGRFLCLLHGDVFAGGHVGANALHAKGMERFYWGKMQPDIIAYVRACQRCSLRKRALNIRQKLNRGTHPPDHDRWSSVIS